MSPDDSDQLTRSLRSDCRVACVASVSNRVRDCSLFMPKGGAVFRVGGGGG